MKRPRKNLARSRRKKPRVRLPLPKKSGGPHGSRKGGKGYDRKKKRKDIERDMQS